MPKENITSVIVAIKGVPDIKKDGQTIEIDRRFTMNAVRSLAAKKLSILGDYTNIRLVNTEGKVLDEIDQLKNQKVIYADIQSYIQETIPGPTKLPFVGSLYEMLPNITEGWMHQFDKHGPVVEVSIMGKIIIGTNDPAIAEIFVKESEYFTKKITNTILSEVKAFAGQGLFTTDTDEMDWQLAHKLLMPAFSPRAIKAYQKDMIATAQQTIKVFEQYKQDEPVEILNWMTNVTFETIGRIGFGYQFDLLNNRDQKKNPFIEAMDYCMRQSLQRVQQAQFMKYLPIESNRLFDRSVRLMHEVVESVIRERKESPDAKKKEKDMLGFMLNARDEHNLGLSDENIRDQVVTFLIAGHDTTANTLSWFLYELARHPEIQAKVLQEIANNHISYDTMPSSKQVSNLKYMHLVLKEVLRKYPPLRGLTKYAKQDCILPGGYRIKAGSSCSIQTYAMHRNKDVYPDPERFDPERWTPEEEQKRSRFAWLPFSTGPRGCIGMAFALQEAKTVLSMLLSRFEFRHDGSEIKMDQKMATTKPDRLFMTIHPREDFPEPKEVATVYAVKKTPLPEVSKGQAVELPPITFLYGSQTGTAQDYATVLSEQARSFGFDSVAICEMDQWKVLMHEKPVAVDTQGLVIICAATYNGQPPDSAEKFDGFLDRWMREADYEKILSGLSYAVFGLGNKNWRTYQHFPIKIVRCLDELGAEALFLRGEGDGDKDMDADFNEWCAHLWSHLLNVYGLTASKNRPVIPSAAARESKVEVRFIQSTDEELWKSALNDRNGSPNASVLINKELQKGYQSTRHVEIDIAQLSGVGDHGQLYNAGDHLEVMAENDQATVEAIASSFGWALDSAFEIKKDSLSGVSPRSIASSIHGPCTIRNMLTFYADLTSPPSRTVLSCLSALLRRTAPETAREFEELVLPVHQDQYPSFIRQFRTLLDLTRAYPQMNSLDLGQFLAVMPVIQPRRYSIASSPLVYPTQAHLAVAVVDDRIGDRHYPGLCSSFLKQARQTLCVSLRSSKATFSLPKDPTVPLIMISAGTGIAPFLGFLQERQARPESAASVLFFGCRHKDQDYIYQEDLEAFTKTGVLSHLYLAFSRDKPSSGYVQDQILANAAEVWDMVCPVNSQTKPAAIYVCGRGPMSRDVRRTFCNMAVFFGTVSSEQEADAFINSLVEEKRYNEDVWG